MPEKKVRKITFIIHQDDGRDVSFENLKEVSWGKNYARLSYDDGTKRIIHVFSGWTEIVSEPLDSSSENKED